VRQAWCWRGEESEQRGLEGTAHEALTSPKLRRAR
jgi:hypothetical protein